MDELVLAGPSVGPPPYAIYRGSLRGLGVTWGTGELGLEGSGKGEGTLS